MNETCDYHLRGNVPCGQPATHRYFTAARHWFYLCPDHCAQVYRDTRKKVDPTPLVKTLMAESAIGDRPLAIFPPLIPDTSPQTQADVRPGKSLSQLFREMQENQSEPDRI